MREMVTAQELGQLLRVAPRTLYRWARAGVIPSLKVRKRLVRFDHKAVLEALSGVRQPLDELREVVAEVNDRKEGKHDEA